MIISDKRIQEKYPNTLTRELSDINEIVLHGTAGFKTSNGIIDWMLKGERDNEYKKNIGLFHYLIDMDGKIIQLFDLEKWFYHSSSGKHDKNTIGIELINSKADNSNEYTNEQYKGLLELICDYLLLNYNITTITSHSANSLIYSEKDKTIECPGKKFRWDIITNELISRGYKHKIPNEKYVRIKNIKLT